MSRNAVQAHDSPERERISRERNYVLREREKKSKLLRRVQATEAGAKIPRLFRHGLEEMSLSAPASACPLLAKTNVTTPFKRTASAIPAAVLCKDNEVFITVTEF